MVLMATIYAATHGFVVTCGNKWDQEVPFNNVNNTCRVIHSPCSCTALTEGPALRDKIIQYLVTPHIKCWQSSK